MQYRFILKDNNQKAYRLFVWFLFFLHVVAASVIGLNAVSPDIKLSVYILLGIYALITFVYYGYRKKDKALDTYSFIMALLYANFWLKHVGVIALFIFILIFLFVFIVNQKKTAVLFSDKGVHLAGVFKTIIYPWQEMDNVILKDNLLTIDLKSNKLIQAEIDETAEQTDETLFNGFCKDQLQKNA